MVKPRMVIPPAVLGKRPPAERDRLLRPAVQPPRTTLPPRASSTPDGAIARSLLGARVVK